LISLVTSCLREWKWKNVKRDLCWRFQHSFISRFYCVASSNNVREQSSSIISSEERKIQSNILFLAENEWKSPVILFTRANKNECPIKVFISSIETKIELNFANERMSWFCWLFSNFMSLSLINEEACVILRNWKLYSFINHNIENMKCNHIFHIHEE
jgi:hypothetical protein